MEAGKPIERELAGGQSHAYQMALAAGQYLNVVVEQRGIDVAVTLFGPDGKRLIEVDSPNGEQGPEPVKWIVETAGLHRLVVRSLENDARPGRYEVKLIELRAVTERDRDLAEADKLGKDAESLRRKRQYDQAIQLAERALSLREKAHGAEHPDVADSLDNLAYLYEAKGDYSRPESLYLRALAINEKMLGAEHPGTASSLNNLALFYQAKGDYGQAELLLRRALAIREKIFGVDHPSTVIALDNLSVIYNHKGDFERAEALSRRALAIREKEFGAEHPDTALSLNNLAALCLRKGDYTQAEPLFHRALAIYEKVRGVEHPDTAYSVNNLAMLYYTKGDYAQAEPFYHRAIAIHEKLFGAEHPRTATSLNSLAALYHAKGDNKQAEPLYRRVLAIREKALGAEHPDTATSLNNLANLLRDQGDYVQAEPLYYRALSIREKALGAEHFLTAQILNNLANLYHAKGDYAQAEPLHRRSLAIREKALGAEHAETANSLNNLANLYYAKGDYEQAEPLYRRALSIREKALGVGHPDTASSLNNLAKLYEATGNVLSAVNYRSRAQAIEERNIALNLATGSERQKLAYLTTLADRTAYSVRLHVRSAPADQTALDLALTAILQRKGRVLEVVTGGTEALRRRASPQDRALLDQLKEARAQLARLVLGGPQRVPPAEHRQAIKGLEESVEKLEVEISSRSVEFRIQSQPITIASVQAAIPPDAALIEFYRYDYKESRYVAYVLRQRGEAQWVDLGEPEAIEQVVDKLRQALRDAKRQDVKQLARAVEQKVMRPVRALLGEKGRLLISPDGSLNLIPFAALVDENGRYLVDRYSFTHLTSGRDLLRLQVKQQSGSDTTVFADPAFDETSSKDLAADRDIRPSYDSPQPTTLGFDFTKARFNRLPGTADEALALRRMMPDAKVLTQDQATESALKQINRPRILHIATHGFFLQDQEVKTAGGRGESLPDILGRVENPLLRSGLALAGANLRKSGDEDGILTAMEAAGLDLWGTKLVVLSACDTGVGEVKNGDGVYGLRRALVLAGSESQVMSLWPVSDLGTRDLMVSYYKRLLRGEGRGEALRQVQVQLLKSKTRNHPYYWASFIQSGEWADLDDRR
ncbi:MAG: tetratricopeptide repeat protein [Blastocatellia bacterium]